MKNTPESGHIVEIRGIDITYVTTSKSTASSQNESITVEDNMTKTDPPKQLELPETEFWQSRGCGWPDETCILFLILNVVKRKREIFLLFD